MGGVLRNSEALQVLEFHLDQAARHGKRGGSRVGFRGFQTPHGPVSANFEVYVCYPVPSLYEETSTTILEVVILLSLQTPDNSNFHAVFIFSHLALKYHFKP